MVELHMQNSQNLLTMVLCDPVLCEVSLEVWMLLPAAASNSLLVIYFSVKVKQV